MVPAEILEPQLFDWLKSAGAEIETLAMTRLAVPVFETVTFCAAPVVFVSWLPKVRLAGETLPIGAGVTGTVEVPVVDVLLVVVAAPPPQAMIHRRMNAAAETKIAFLPFWSSRRIHPPVQANRNQGTVALR
jgi:hypothetical protein